ncbi:PHD finger protein 14 [Chelonia mydas]|uniref:PHD finger protein 14 n=1 Tax=Chelonia mydas TaxID=8469 RepID=M7BG26_CHEMY|nr:PHD finger protein 14 [Chelonia mydas]
MCSTDSEGSGRGSEDASKDSGEGSCSESEENVLEEELAEEMKVEEEQQPKTSAGETLLTTEDVIKTEKKEQEEEDEKPKKKKEKEKATETDAAADEQTNEPKKWNLRRNRPLLDFVSMEELNDMDDYDSEDDNDWRPTAGKKKGKTALRKEGSDGDNEEDEDDGSGSDEDDNDEEGNEDNSSTASDGGSKKKKHKVLSRNSADDEELTNDSLALSQSKSNEDSLILEKSQNWTSQKMDHILICCVCLGDNSEDADEIIQCDNCGITVHEDSTRYSRFDTEGPCGISDCACFSNYFVYSSKHSASKKSTIKVFRVLCHTLSKKLLNHLINILYSKWKD